jgi:hypothetical protein
MSEVWTRRLLRKVTQACSLLAAFKILYPIGGVKSCEACFTTWDFAMQAPQGCQRRNNKRVVGQAHGWSQPASGDVSNQ